MTTPPPSSAELSTLPTLVVAPDLEGLARLAADRVRVLAGDALSARGRFRIALAGGSTPRALYSHLATSDLDWARTDVFFGDERNVGPDDPQSNFRMARETLLSPAGVPPENVHRLRGEDPDLESAAFDYENALGGPAAPPFDLVLLGMGVDGHTASLFPGTAALDERRRLCVANDVPQLATRRLTLTYPVFEAARDLLFLVAGADKADTLRDVLGPVRDARRWPSQVLLRRTRPRPALLFCDRAAVSKLPAPQP
ncbi:MAG TPA: 6-phosphogluconolactonase [Polyangia bacterium]|nr:6-phosphogluconolactonase [Polyangia bacterium]